VTGGGGFLGRHIVRKLRERGFSVRVAGRRAYPDLAAGGVECVRADVADAEAVRNACAGVAAVFHVASRSGIWGPRSVYHRDNVLGAENILAACRHNGVRRLVYTSTPSVVYGDGPIEGGDESLPYPRRYLTPYAATKAEAEQMILAANGDGFRTCALRPHLVWGPGNDQLIQKLIWRARNGRLAQVGDGKNRISVSYVENVADAHVAALDALANGTGAAGKAYFVNDTEPVLCWEFIRRILECAGAPYPKRRVPLWLAYGFGAVCEAAGRLTGRKADPVMTRFLAMQFATSHWFRTDAARRDLGWSPAVSLDEGLCRFAIGLRNAGLAT
jgi:nucleoside-diphosphate-sugar epimerase